MPHLSDSENIDSVQLEEQASAPDTPASGYWRIYAKSDGLYIVEDDGTEHGPFSATTGDMEKAAYDSGEDGQVDPGAGGTGQDTSGDTGVATVSSGVWSILAQLTAALGGTGQDTSGDTGVATVATGTWSILAQLTAALGGTGQDTSSDTGIAKVASGVWSVVQKLIDGSYVANVANDQTTPGVPVLFPVAIAGGAAADTDVTIDGKHRVIDVWAVHTGGAGEASDTIQVKNGTDAITDAMDWSGGDKAIVRAAEIDDANYEIADSGTLRVTTTDDDAGNDVGAGVVYVLAIPVA